MALRQEILNEPVSALSLRPLVTFSPDDPVRKVCDAMAEAQLGAAIAVDSSGRTVGMFNEKLLIRLLNENPEAMDEAAEKHMTRNVTCVKTTDTIATLIATMQHRKLRWVCVVDESGKATALSGLRGVMEYIVEHVPRWVSVQSMDAKLAMDEREGA